MTTLDKAAILAAKDREIAAVDVPEWGGEVYVQAMSAAQVATFKALSLAAVDMSTGSAEEFRVKDFSVIAALECKVVAWCLCDENGKRLFTDAEVEALGEKSPTVIERIADRAVEISGIRTTVADAKKKSESRKNGSGTDLPLPSAVAPSTSLNSA